MFIYVTFLMIFTVRLYVIERVMANNEELQLYFDNFYFIGRATGRRHAGSGLFTYITQKAYR